MKRYSVHVDGKFIGGGYTRKEARLIAKYYRGLGREVKLYKEEG